jgi:hypothetical protein
MGHLLSLLNRLTASFFLNCSEIALLLFGLLVAVGVYGESRKSLIWTARHGLFELLVVIGVAGEFFADGGIFFSSRRVQIIADTNLAHANQEAADARLEADKIEERMEYRTLKKDQQGQALITAKLRPFAEQHFQLDTYRDDPDCAYFSSKFELAMQNAGWIPRSGETISSKALRMGIIVMVHSGVDETTEKASSELVDELNAEGLTAAPVWHFPPGWTMQDGKTADANDTTIVVTVGRKPP